MQIKDIKGSYGSALRIYHCPEKFQEELQAKLTFDNPDYATIRRFSPWENTTVPATVCLLKDFYDYVELPRGFSPQCLSRAGRCYWNRIRWEDDRVRFNVKFPPARLTLNDDQRRVEKQFLAMEAARERPSGSYLFVVPTSAGKTILQASLASRVGQRTLVLCKTNLIRKAWQDDLNKLYGFTKKDLGLIQQKSFKLGEHVTLASIATLVRRRELWHELFSQIGCLIIDEVQIIGADLIEEIVSACPARYIIGMTATDTRRDGKTFVVHAHMGRAGLRIANKQVETDSSFPLSNVRVVRTPFVYKDPNGKPVPREMMDFNELTQQMIDDPVRNHLVVEEAVKDWKEGHSVLVTTPRIEHAQVLQALLNSHNTGAMLLTGSTNSDSYYTEKMIENILARKCRMVVATTQAVKLGANLNPLDRLHTAIPPSNKQDLEQLIGRIRRKHPGKKDAVLIYYHDLQTPYWHSRFKSVFVPTMRKLRVPRYVNLFVA